MTARHQIRIGSRRLARDRSVIDATPAPSLGEVLQAARERKGVDLYRAERDTKIRLKYLAALEDDDLADLPSPVYTKGFIRNYALYLSLEPEEVISRWREQLQVQQRQDRVVVAPPPRPLVAPRRGVSITPGMIVAAMLSVAVLAFLGYIGWQVMRFASATPVALTYPPSQVFQIDAESITLAGTAAPAASITITDASGQSYDATANSDTGAWSKLVSLSKGQNDFEIVARDRVTERESDPIKVIITVPLPDTTGPPPPLATPQALRLDLTSPTSGTTSADGSITVAGTTTGSRITITTELLTPLPGGSPSPSPQPETPSPDESPGPTATPAGPIDITVPVSGAFSETVQLGQGSWRITVSAHATSLEPVTQMRLVAVDGSQPISEGEIELVLEGQGSSWMRIVVDGEQLRPRSWGGPTLRNGATVNISANSEVWLRVGNAGNVRVTLNGRDLGTLGRRGQVANWIIEPGNDPRQTSETR
jgi:cytoskeletal protein RodZ